MTDPAEEAIHVLLVTNDDDYATKTAENLSALDGIEVTTTDSVRDAMAKLTSASDIECVISDHDLPDIDAIAFLETVRLKYLDLPFILFTAEGSERIASRAIHARVTDYLIKQRQGNQWSRLADLIRQAVAYYRSHDTVLTDDSRIHTLSAAMPDAVFILRDGQIQHVNESGMGLLGIRDEAELLGTPFMDLFIEDNEITQKKIEAIQRGDRHIGAIKERVLDLSGTQITVELTVSRIHWEGKPATLAILADRSEHASMAKRLSEAVRINTLIHEVNRLIINAQSREEIEQGTCDRLVESGDYRLAWIGALDSESERIKPRAAAGLEQGYLDAIEITSGTEPTARGPTGQAIKTGKIQVAQNLAEDPSYGPWREEATERDYRSSAAIPLLSNGQRLGVLNLYSDRPWAFNRAEREMLKDLGGDIGHAIRAIKDRSALQRSRERLGLALEAARAGVWEWDVPSGSVIWDESVEDLFGLEPGTFEGTQAAFKERVHPDDLSIVEREIEGGLDETDRIACEFRIRSDVWGERWILSLGDVHRDEEGNPSRVIGVNMDITNRKERELHFQVIDRVLRHNLRNNINYINGSADLIAEEVDPDLAELANGISRYGEKLLETAEKQREIVEILTEDPGERRVEIAPLVENVVNRITDRFPEADIDIQADEGLPAITISARITRAVEELIENAVIHNDQDRPLVSVSIDQSDSEIQVSIEDDGPTIPEMNIEVLTRAAEQPLYHGSGLGLWLVHWIVRRSNGQIDFREKQPSGNIVTLRLPI